MVATSLVFVRMICSRDEIIRTTLFEHTSAEILENPTERQLEMIDAACKFRKIFSGDVCGGGGGGGIPVWFIYNYDHSKIYIVWRSRFDKKPRKNHRRRYAIAPGIASESLIRSYHMNEKR